MRKWWVAMNRKIVLPNGKEVKPPFKLTWVITLIVILLIALSIYITNFDISLLVTNANRASKYFSQLFNFNEKTYAFIPNIYKPLLETIAMSLVGSLAGMLLAFPVGIICAININNNFFTWILRCIFNILRTLPILIVGLIFKYIFGASNFSGFIAISITTFLIGIKMLYEYIETLNLASYESALATGLNKFQAIVSTIIPNIRSYFVSQTLYMFEVNVRMATILGLVGGGGIGLVLNDQLTVNPAKAGMILIFMFVVVLTIELITGFLRKRLA